MSTASDPTSGSRRSVYLLMTAAAVGIAGAKVVGAENVLEPSRYTAPTKDAYSAVPPDPPRKWPDRRPEPTPMFSSNDKSRWATVRALVDDGTFVVGRRVYPDGRDATKYKDEGIVFDNDYRTLDVVMRPIDDGDRDGPQVREFYSTKPPLMPVAIAGEYWLLRKLLGWSITGDRWLVIPTILLTVNVIPFAVYLVLLARLIETTGKTDFGRLLAFATTCFGTFLTTFSGTLNNHTHAAFAVLFAVYPLMKAMAESREVGTGGYLCCGFFAGLAATLELPAAAFLAGIGLPLLIARPVKTLLFFVPLALIPFAADRALNYVALGELAPAYEKFGGPWYEYHGSHWLKLKLPPGHPDRKGIDFNDEPTTVYAFHLLFGHHGWFSLTPVWLVAVVGLVGLGIRSASDLKRLRGAKGSPWTPPLFAGMTLAVSVVVFAFYLTRTSSYNYGGNTSGPRWLFWLTPLWLVAIPPAADRLAVSRWGRGLAAVLLGFSVLSVFYPAWNPWRSPWLLQLLEFTGRVRY
jgi:hypothetical protein